MKPALHKYIITNVVYIMDIINRVCNLCIWICNVAIGVANKKYEYPL